MKHSVASVSQPIGGRQGRYELKEQIAAGGMGVILRAYDRLARRVVAYKRLVVSDESARARMTLLFQREYDTLARLPHPNIVECFDYGHAADGPYYAMELLTGSDLTKLAPMAYPEACRVLRDVASALALVHARGLIHRDISPANVRVTDEGRVKLIDFGALTPFGRPEELVGTPACMAPECLSDGLLDQRSDLYSLGALAYWLLTGRAAVRARYIEDLLDAWGEPLLPPSAHVPELPKELDALVLSLLAREPNGRPANAAYVIERLTTIASLSPEADEHRVAYSYLAHPPLTGRGAIVSMIQSAMAEAREGRGGVLLVQAAAGLGRSALLDVVALQAQLSGCTVLRGRGERKTGPFGLARKLTNLASTLYLDLSGAQSARRSFMTYRPGDNAQTAADVSERHALVIESVRNALLELSERTTIVMVIDDLHESDPESVALLASLAQESSARPICIIASTLSGTSTGLEQSAYALLAATAQQLALAPLDQEQVVELVQRMFGSVPNGRRLGQWLHAQSAGNPATCLDLTRLLLQRGLVRYTLGTFTLPHTLDAELPSADLSNAVLARLGHLGAHAHSVAEALSLHDGPLSSEQLASALDLPERDVQLALEELSSRGVVQQGEEGATFAGSSLRATLQQRMASEQKRSLHQRLARALREHGDGLLDARFHAGTHLLLAGQEAEAAELVAELGHAGMTGESASRWVVLIEAVLLVYRKQRRSKEQFLALLIPLMHAGFYGELGAQRRHIDDAVRWMSSVCGMTLAARMRPYVGGMLALMSGLLYASLRRLFTPKRDRLGTLPEMLGEFVGMISAGTAAAVSSDENAAAIRYNRYLEPLSALPPTTSGFLLREFCLATVEVGIGELRASSQRYARLMPALQQPIQGLDDKLRQTIYRGCLNGRAQAELQDVGRGALVLADELSQGDPFFAPHAECARMGYFGYRGEQDKAELHRARAELLALHGGNAWSAETIIAKRQVITAIVTRDAIGLVQAIAAVERLQAVAPKLIRCKSFCEAWLACMRGHPEQGVALYEAEVEAPGARLFYSWRFDRACYAALLNAAGQHARAKAVCEALLPADMAPEAITDMLHLSVPQLALAEAGLGNLTRAIELLEMHLLQVRDADNALLLGSAHQHRAYVALLAGDRESFGVHFDAMARCYHATRNPSLIQQGEALLARAVAHGLREGVALPPGMLPRLSGERDEMDATTVVEAVPGRESVEQPPSRESVRAASS